MTYPGGKQGSGVYQQIINLIPPHKTYIEPFLGSGAILRMKQPATINIAIDIDPAVAKNPLWRRSPNLTVLQDDALAWLHKNTFGSDTFIYIDPPYLIHTRRSPRRIYPYELSNNDHFRLLQIIKKLECMVMISGYPNAFYDDALSSWWTKTFQATTRGNVCATEKLWMNYPPPTQLHDYRYLGEDFRERERIKRKKKRWISRLLSMPDLERHALTAAIAEIDGAGQHRHIERSAPVLIADHIDTAGDTSGEQPQKIHRQIK